MIDYDNLRKLAEAAKGAMDSCASPPMEWTDFDFCQEAFSGEWTAYIKAVNPRTVLRLLDIITVAKDALEKFTALDLRSESRRSNASLAMKRQSQQAIDEIAKLEKE